MRQNGNRLGMLAGLIALAAVGCTTTYSDADYHEAEARHADEDRAAEQRRQAEIANEGGASGEIIRESEDQVIMDAER